MTTARKQITRSVYRPEPPEVKLIVSQEKQPKVALKPGMRVEVTTVKLVDPNLARPPKIAARLCGGSGTCLALIDLGETVKPL